MERDPICAPARKRLNLTQDVLGRLIQRGLELALGMKAQTLDKLSKWSAFNLCLVYCFSRMFSSDKLSNSFHAAGINGRLDLSLPRWASCCPTNCPCSTRSGACIARFAKEIVVHNRRSSAGWMPARAGKSSVGVG